MGQTIMLLPATMAEQGGPMMNADAPNASLMVQWILGGVIVILYARDRFDDPSRMRAMTTFGRYWLAWCGYIVAMLALFVLLGGGITEIDASMLFRTLQALGGEMPKDHVPPGPLLAALALTSLLPHVPLLKGIDAAVKDWFQRVGNIPFEVRDLAARLRRANYTPPEEWLQSSLQELQRFKVDSSWLSEPRTTFKYRWTLVTLLYIQVQHWQDSRVFGRYVHEHKSVLNDLRSRIDALGEYIDGTTLSSLDGVETSFLMSHVRRKTDRDITDLSRALFDFIAGGILSRARTSSQRDAEISKLGFSGLPATPSTLSAHDLVLVSGLVFLAMLFVPLALRRFVSPAPLDQQIRVLIMVPIIYTISIVVAIYPKSVWSFAMRKGAGPRPYAAYATSGLVAAAVAFVVALIFRFAFDTQGNVLQALASPGAFANAWNLSVDRWPWLIMTFFVTVAVAWAADDHVENPASESLKLRIAEAASLAIVFSVMSWAVVQLLAAGKSPAEAARLLSAMPQMIATSAVIGSCIGWFVPHLYRTRAHIGLQESPGRGGSAGWSRSGDPAL